MANNVISTTIFIVVFFSVIFVGKSHTFSKNLPQTSLGLRKQHLTHLHFFLHDVASGPNTTSISVAAAPSTNTSPTQFGRVFIDDEPLTVGPEPNSTLVGRSQGMFALADLKDPSLMMIQNYVFEDETFNGSTLSILGRYNIFSSMRELTVVGGTGVFRFARGYAQARTYSFNVTTGDAIAEYDVYVLYY